MKMHGLDISMYKHEGNTMEQAWDTFLKVADEFIEANRKKFPWIAEKQKDNPKYSDVYNEADPARASQFYYVKDEGGSTASKI